MEIAHKKATLSLVIPTHNRAESLKRLLKNITSLKTTITLKIIVVDNNSADHTKQIVESFSEHDITYIFEENTSFTKARHTGAAQVETDVFVYLDDDVIIQEGTFDEIVRIFAQHPKAAVVGGNILPCYEQEPPVWINSLQKSFNGFSLYDLGQKVKECDAVPGPIMAIRKSVFDLIGGFPPDTVGVETNSQQKTFKKIYVGPGDYGFCKKCKNAGYQIFYSPKVVVQHVIPPVRLTKTFWLSRMVGEGHCAALTRDNMVELRAPKNEQWQHRKALVTHYLKAKIKRVRGDKSPLLPDEMWHAYYQSLLTMQQVLKKNPGLSAYLWNLGLQGVPDKEFDKVVAILPKAYQDLAL